MGTALQLLPKIQVIDSLVFVKYPDLSKWEYKPELEGLLFFAQLIEELLFNYTIDTYKISTLNLHTLCQELDGTIFDIESGVVRDKAIKPVIEELSDKLISDPVATYLLKDIRDEYISSINKYTALAGIKVKANLLLNQLDKKYLDRTKILLEEVIVDGKRKRDIISLANSFLIELINMGYSSEFIYWESINFFFEASHPPYEIKDTLIIRDYFNIFKNEEL
ncbi:unnamed protein product, partial [marine sediment metagenome]